MVWRALIDDVLEVALPQRCVVCSRFGAALHAECLEALPRADGVRCVRCWAPGSALCARCEDTPPPFEALRAHYRFEGDARAAVLEAKFRGITSLLRPLGLAAAVEAAEWDIDVVVPVPLHSQRLRQRGYNQAELIGGAVAAHLGVPLETDRLRRVRATPAQAGLAAGARARNLRGAFEVRGAVRGTVLVVDDVTTTGSTFAEAARVLVESGAHRVYALAIARED